MGSRRIYLRVAALLRANHDPIDPYEYRHSGIALGLREGVIESKLLFDADLAYMIAFSALHSHSGADVEKGSLQANMMYYDAVARIPYFTKGKGGEDMLQEERMSAVRAFKAMRDKMRKKPRET